MNNRLQQFLTAENISQSAFADTIGVARASVSHILAGRNKPGFDFIESLSKHYPTVNLEWLITGKGKMYKGEQIKELAPVAPTPEPAPEIPAPAPKVEEIITEPKVEEIKSIALAKATQTPKIQRSISRIIVLYNDGSYQELK